MTGFADKTRTEAVIVLEYPVIVDGVTWEKVTARAPNVRQIRDFNRAVTAAKAAGQSLDEMRLPMFDAPDAVLDELHPDDDDKLSEASEPFLPQRFRVASPETASE
jgi:hypothetical protein